MTTCKVVKAESDILCTSRNAVDVVSVTGHGAQLEAGVEVTLIDNGMPVVCLKASDFGVSGYESPAELEANSELRAKVEAVRLAGLDDHLDLEPEVVHQLGEDRLAGNEGLGRRLGGLEVRPARVEESLRLEGRVSRGGEGRDLLDPGAPSAYVGTGLEFTINAGGTISADSAASNAYNIGPVVLNGSGTPGLGAQAAAAAASA